MLSAINFVRVYNKKQVVQTKLYWFVKMYLICFTNDPR